VRPGRWPCAAVCTSALRAQAALNTLLGGGSAGRAEGSGVAVQRVTVIRPSLPFVYVSFTTEAHAERARRALDRREVGSAPVRY
jgi:hypothetical protein